VPVAHAVANVHVYGTESLVASAGSLHLQEQPAIQARMKWIGTARRCLLEFQSPIVLVSLVVKCIHLSMGQLHAGLMSLNIPHERATDRPP
jgi:hypothetical protein